MNFTTFLVEQNSITPISSDSFLRMASKLSQKKNNASDSLTALYRISLLDSSGKKNSGSGKLRELKILNFYFYNDFFTKQ